MTSHQLKCFVINFPKLTLSQKIVKILIRLKEQQFFESSHPGMPWGVSLVLTLSKNGDFFLDLLIWKYL